MSRIIPILIAIILSVSCSQSKENKENNTKTVEKTDSIVIDSDKPKGFSFNVNEVKVASYPLETDSAIWVMEKKSYSKLLFYPEPQSAKLIYSNNNVLLQTIHICFDQHRPLVLSPDIIWLTICQGVSIHINERFNELKHKIFNIDKPVELIIRNDKLELASEQWMDLINSLSNSTKKYTRDDYYSFFVPEFSSTTAVHKTAYQITLLNSYKKIINYTGTSGCGIPSIHITGTKDDWQLILKKIDMLDKIGLSDWAGNLRPIIKEFILASEGKPNIKFWKDIYKTAVAYSEFYISGWIIKFFPYVTIEEGTGKKDINDMPEIKIFLAPNKFLNGNDYLLSDLTIVKFPSGLVAVPIKWINNNTGITKKMNVQSGFFGIKQYSDNSLEPFISWGIFDDFSKVNYHKMKENYSESLTHNYEYWSPIIPELLLDSAIYNHEKFTSQAESNQFIRSVILDSLQKNITFKAKDYAKDTIVVLILLDGTVSNVSLKKSKNKLLTAKIKSIILGLPEKWKPATSDRKSIRFYKAPKGSTKLPTHSFVKIPL